MNLFANGTEFFTWKERNCDDCTKSFIDGVWPCPLEKAMDLASIADGTVPAGIADRLGFTDGALYPLDECPERVVEASS